MSVETEMPQHRTSLLGIAALPPSDTAEPEAGRPAVLTEAETAQLTRLSARTLQRLAEDGRGPARIKLSARRIGYWRADVEAWLAARTTPAKHKDAA